MSDINNKYDDDWKMVSGPWYLTQHAKRRLFERYDLLQTQVDELMDNLLRENLVRVPNFKENEGTYTVQSMIEDKGVFLIAEKNTKNIRYFHI